MLLHRWEYVFCFFFFQAEDGIRDGRVTGVQTCALPISHLDAAAHILEAVSRDGDALALQVPTDGSVRSLRAVLDRLDDEARSEERRVGKECRSRWSSCHRKNNAITHVYT